MAAPDRDRVELTFSVPSRRLAAASTPSGEPASGERARFLMLWFSCANVYGRAYRSPDGKRYRGQCPACGQCVNFGIGAGGTDTRTFEVSCR